MATRALFLILLAITLASIPACRKQPQQDSSDEDPVAVPQTTEIQPAEIARDVVVTDENWPIPGLSLPPGCELVEFKSDGENLWQATFNSTLDYEATLKHVDDILLEQGFKKDDGQPPSSDGFVIRYDNPLADLSVMFMYVPIDDEARSTFPEGIEPFDYTLGVFRDSYLVKE